MNDDESPDRESGRRSAIEGARRLSIIDRLTIRWNHRRVANPRTWHDRVRFDEIVCSNYWDLAPNFDDLNERYEAYRRQPWQRQADEQRRREQGEREAQ